MEGSDQTSFAINKIHIYSKNSREIVKSTNNSQSHSDCFGSNVLFVFFNERVSFDVEFKVRCEEWAAHRAADLESYCH